MPHRHVLVAVSIAGAAASPHLTVAGGERHAEDLPQTQRNTRYAAPGRAGWPAGAHHDALGDVHHDVIRRFAPLPDPLAARVRHVGAAARLR